MTNCCQRQNLRHRFNNFYYDSNISVYFTLLFLCNLLWSIRLRISSGIHLFLADLFVLGIISFNVCCMKSLSISQWLLIPSICATELYLFLTMVLYSSFKLSVLTSARFSFMLFDSHLPYYWYMITITICCQVGLDWQKSTLSGGYPGSQIFWMLFKPSISDYFMSFPILPICRLSCFFFQTMSFTPHISLCLPTLKVPIIIVTLCFLHSFSNLLNSL